MFHPQKLLTILTLVHLTLSALDSTWVHLSELNLKSSALNFKCTWLNLSAQLYKHSTLSALYFKGMVSRFFNVTKINEIYWMIFNLHKQIL